MIVCCHFINLRTYQCFASSQTEVLSIAVRYKVEQHDYELYLAVNDIDHTKTKAASPQTNGICERFHKTILQEFYQITFRKKLYSSLEELQVDLDDWLKFYNTERTHQGKMCCGRTPLETLLDGKRIWAEKNLAQI